MSNTLVKVSINIKEGSLNLEADSTHLDAATESALRMIDKLLSAQIVSHDQPPVSEVTAHPTHAPAQSIEASEEPAGRVKIKRKKGGARTKNWQFKPNMLNENDWLRVKAFYKEKAPATQNEKVAVIVSVLSSITGRTGIDGHEIHTTFKTLGEKTPANLTGVLGNMTGLGLGNSSEGKFQLGFSGNQMVDHDLPKKVSNKA